jgi:tellurite resistance protein TerB
MITLIDWVKNQTESIRRSLSKIVNRDFMEAVSAGCALVAAADGVVKTSEKEKMRRFIEESEILQSFEPQEIVAAFDKYVHRMEQDYLIGEAEAHRAIGMIRSNPHNARLLVRVCSAICVSDGTCNDKEMDALGRICRELHLDLEALIGSTEDIVSRSDHTVSVEGRTPPPIPEPREPAMETAEPVKDKTEYILAKTPYPKQHVMLDARTGEVRYRFTDVAVASAFSVMVNDSDGNNLFNINAGAKEGSALVYDSGNRLLASIHRTSAIYRHYAIDDKNGNRRYDFAESSTPGAGEWAILSEESEIGGVRQISHKTSQAFMNNRGADLEDLSLDGAVLLYLKEVVEEKDLFAISGGAYLLMVG